MGPFHDLVAAIFGEVWHMNIRTFNKYTQLNTSFILLFSVERCFMKLSKWAKNTGISYMTAWRMFHSNQIKNAYRLPTGTIIVPENPIPKLDHTVVYARVSSSENRPNLNSQAERVSSFCCAKGWVVKEVIKECASGLNDSRPKLRKVLTNPLVTRVVVEHKDRLTRFGFSHIKDLCSAEIVVINEVKEDEADLMQDFVSLVTSFTARLYGKRRSRRNTEKLIKELSKP